SYVRTNGGRLNNAHAGVGSVSYTACVLLNSIIGAAPTYVPYTGGGPTLNALVGGQVDYMCDQAVSSIPQIRSGNVKAYAVASLQRIPALPDVPVTAEAGLPAYQVSAWNAFFAPKDTPQPIIAKLNAALSEALDDPSIQKRLADLGGEIPSRPQRSPEALGKLVHAEVVRWTPVLKALASAN
ncbi:MAG: hypothetical protein QOH67_2025, partial [Hyphomicrobiales bacterium]|nr:hypothetical protein [Hyphomicrobiales bacterium]